MLITLDIETLPSECEVMRAAVAAEITPPGNMSKADTIAAWEAEKKPALVDQAMRKTSFDGTYGRILCIGWAVDDGEPEAFIGDEDNVLFGFFERLREALSVTNHGRQVDADPVFVGHNLSGFDLRFIWQRAVLHKIRPPHAILNACKAKPWDKCIADTMLMWNPDRERRISLDKLCKALGVETSKGDMDGSKVYDEYKAGNLDKISAYCKADVAATRECYRRMMFAEAA